MLEKLNTITLEAVGFRVALKLSVLCRTSQCGGEEEVGAIFLY